jgi:hypothetical protein
MCFPVAGSVTEGERRCTRPRIAHFTLTSGFDRVSSSREQLPPTCASDLLAGLALPRRPQLTSSVAAQRGVSGIRTKGSLVIA